METVEITIERRSGHAARAPRAGCATAGSVPGDPLRPEAEHRDHQRQTRASSSASWLHLEGSHLIRLVHTGGGDAELHDTHGRCCARCSATR